MKFARAFAFSTILLGLVSPMAANAKNIWRDCGIGALVFSETKWAAVTSNITWDLGVTASSTYTSSEKQCGGKGANAARFIESNYALLEEQTATGEGPHLTTMLEVLECRPETHGGIIKDMRSHLQKDLEAGKHGAEIYYNHLIETVSGQYSAQCGLI